MKLGRRTFLGQGTAAAAATSLASPALAQDLAGELDRIRLYDSHEHLTPEKERVRESVDFFGLAAHYLLNDVISAGLTGEALSVVRDAKAPPGKRWAAFEPYWRMARFTGYGQALSIAVRDIYGVEEISGQTLARIDEAIRTRNRPGLYDYVLRERAGIDWCLVDAYWNERPDRLEPEYFLLAQKFDGFVTPASPKDVARLEQVSGVSIQSLAGLKKALAATFERAVRSGMVSVKSTLAYRRELLFHEVSEQDAARDFEAMMQSAVEMPRGFRAQKMRPLRRLEDYMFHQVVRLAEAHRYPFQIHTGLLAGNACFIENTNPNLLANLFHLYPGVKFDLFHIGYPYQEELGVLAKLFPNVHADFCWAHIISPAGSRRTLDEYLETVPVNKILAFGGDYRFPELAYAHARMARRNVVQVLAGKVEAGLFTERQALEVGRLLLRENALALFPPARQSSLVTPGVKTG
ncbi:MAG: amidohydrolase family protein [Bryobacterales bacterium]|nr:amidohydrolase family protein [Bryobacterales bacterium]